MLMDHIFNSNCFSTSKDPNLQSLQSTKMISKLVTLALKLSNTLLTEDGRSQSNLPQMMAIKAWILNWKSKIMFRQGKVVDLNAVGVAGYYNKQMSHDHNKTPKENIKEDLKNIKDNVKQNTAEMKDKVKDNVNDMKSNIKENLKNVKDNIKEEIKKPKIEVRPVPSNFRPGLVGLALLAAAGGYYYYSTYMNQPKITTVKPVTVTVQPGTAVRTTTEVKK